MIDYVDKNGELVQFHNLTPTVMVRTQSDLALLAGKYQPGTYAFTAGHLQEWQMAADGTWVPRVAVDAETAAIQAAASAQRASEDALTAQAAATAAQENTEGLAGWSLTKEENGTVIIDYSPD